MTTRRLELTDGAIAFDDSGGDGPLVVMLPGAGDVRAEYRYLAPQLAATGARVVTADLRGHGESSADWPRYGVAETASDLVALLDHLDAGPATVVATSFAPAAALWVAAEHPGSIARLILISPHIEAAPAWQRIPLGLLMGLTMRGPLAGPLWTSQFRKWHPAVPPADLDEQVAALKRMLEDPRRRRAARETLTAHRDGLDERISRVDAPALVVMGGADSHFGDPAAVGASIASRLGGSVHVVPRAGHYPHVEFPDDVSSAIMGFLAPDAA